MKENIICVITNTLLFVCALLVVLFMTGCATLPADPASMSADQIKALALDKNASVACTVINSPYGRGVATFVNLDRAVIAHGTVSVDAECKVTITNSPK
jgi:hypothetical protein